MAKKFLTIDTNGFHKLVDGLDDSVTSINTGWSSDKTEIAIKTEAVEDYALNSPFKAKQVVLDTVSNKMYRVVADFTSDSSDIQNDIIANKLTLVGGGGDIVYTNATPVVQTLGGIQVGKTFSNETITQILNELLYPYVAPAVSLVSSPVATLKEFGDTISSVSLTATTSKNSNPITSVEFLRNGVSINTVGTPNGIGGAEAYVDNTIVNANTNYTCKVGDGTSFTTSNQVPFNFVYPIYVGNLSVATPVEADIKGMTKLIQAKSDTVNNYTIVNSRFCFAYPKSYGNLTGIKDINVFEILGDFTKTEITMTMLDGVSIPYYIYTYDNVTTVNNFTVTYKF